MEHYPSQYTSQPAPLVVIQGLGKHPDHPLLSPTSESRKPELPSRQPSSSRFFQTKRLERVLSEVKGPMVEPLVSIFEQYDIQDDIWSSHFTRTNYQHHNNNSLVFNLQFVDEKFELPEQKSLDSNVTSESPRQKSKLSPFNQNSNLYPFGLLHDEWANKYKQLLPSVFISFHQLVTEIPEELSNEQKDQFLNKADMGLAKEIITLKNQIQNSGTIKFLEVIVSDSKTPVILADRINNIRNITGLAPRTGLLFLPAGSDKEYKIFVEAVLHLIQPWCFDYYIHLEKKFRRKMVNPPLNSLTKSLTLDDKYSIDQWNARYALKLALINIFHQNNEMSVKHLESAYQALNLLAGSISLDVACEKNNYTELWHEILKFLDILTISIVKEYLYLELTNKAYRRFDQHVKNTLRMFKYKGVDTDSYPVLNWLSIQYEWLGELCVMADEYIIPIDKPILSDFNFGSTAMPQPGYIFLQSISFLQKCKLETKSFGTDRKLIELSLPEEKLIKSEDDAEFLLKANDPNIKKVFRINDEEFIDYYKCLPIEDQIKYPFHQKTIVLLQKAMVSFMKSKQSDYERSISFINFQLGEENYELKNYEKAIEYFEDSFQVYKRDKWKPIEVEILIKLVYCLEKVGNYNALIMYLLELSIIDEIYYTNSILEYLKDFSILSKLKQVEKDKPTILNIHPLDETVMPPSLFTGGFLFKEANLPLTQTSNMQFSLKNIMNGLIFPEIKIDSIIISIDGSLSSIKLQQDDSKSNDSLVKLSNDEFVKEDDRMVGKVNLLFKPNQIKIFQLSQISKEINRNRVESIIINFSINENFSLKYHLPVIPHLADDAFLDDINNPTKITPHNVDVNSNYFVNKMAKKKFFWVTQLNPLRKSVIITPNPYETFIIPRRPKTTVTIENPTNAYGNEIYQLKLLIDNQDNEDIGMIFRPMIKIFNNNNHVNNVLNTKLPSSQVSSRVTSPRNSLDVRARSASLEGVDNKEIIRQEPEGIQYFNCQWDGIDSLINDKEKIIDLKLTKVLAKSKEHHSLFIKVPNINKQHFVIKIECSYFTGNNIEKQQESEEETRMLGTRDTISIRTPILDPFMFSFSLLPKVRNEDISNIFIFDANKSIDGFVKHERTWMGKPVIEFIGNSATSLKILSTSTEINTTNPKEFDCEKITNQSIENRIINSQNSILNLEELFVTSKKSVKQQANVPVSVKIRVKWRRNDSNENIINTTESQVWKPVMPLFQPRVLCEIHKLQDSIYKLKYYLENPTPRILTFSTLIDNNNNFEISGKNKQISKLLVLPFSKQEFEFQANIKSSAIFLDGNRLKIPQFKVFDLVYKVTVQVSLASVNGLVDRTDIYIKI